ncbi:hypothetical protein ACEWY4_022305 [Coilia grayii]|uniref:Ig-like domain-containing protein n=1 Tax=Coilia grayii TaxID=363190 RepID=A0ABD1J5L9_9TELE
MALEEMPSHTTSLLGLAKSEILPDAGKSLLNDTLSSRLNTSAVLRCYADTEKSRNPYNLWEKVDTERRVQVLQFKSGNFSYEPKLKGRVWASEDGYSTGDYSMHITKALPSDHGLYLCQYSEREDRDLFRGAPNSALLNVQAKNHALEIKVGDSVNIPITDLAEVTFTRGGDTPPEVTCSVKGGKPECSSKYDGRITVGNNMLTLTHFSLDDGGVYTLREEGEVFSIFNITAIHHGETQSSSTTNIVIICIVALVVVILVVVIVVVWKYLSKRHSNEVRMGALAGQCDGVQHEETGVPSDTTQAEQPTEATALFVPEVDESQLSVPLTETSSHSPLPFREKESVSVDMP